jgi:hypothetical protein
MKKTGCTSSATNTRETLMRLKRWLGRERARFERIQRDATSAYSMERAYGESNVCSMVMSKIDSILREQNQ